MRKYLLITLLFLFTLTAKSQIYLNWGGDTTGTETRKALSFYNSYIAAFKDKKNPEMSAYWPSSELQQRTVPDQLMYGINTYPLYLV